MKSRINLWSDRLFKQIQPLPAGMYHFQSPGDVKTQYRLHLRLEPDGKGILVINASTILHLNNTAAEYAYYMINQKGPDEVGRLMQSRYKISAKQAKGDFQNLNWQIQTLIGTPDLAPEIFIDDARLEPYSANISAPYRLDCALTYQTNSGVQNNSKFLEKVKRELTTNEWKSILSKTEVAGIPHVIFTGGEPTIRPDLAELISFTEEKDLVCGLITDGFRLTNPQYLHQLLNSGLDHLMIIVNGEDSACWEALRDVISEDIYVTAHITITQQSVPKIHGWIASLADLKVPSISLSMDDPGLSKSLKDAQEFVQLKGIKLVWDLPVPFSTNHPISVEISEHQEYISGAGKAWLYVEPDGDVLTEQGDSRILGNMVSDEWESIWKNS
jgi:pyruvate-formate lyase-activating enzyme